MTELTKGSTRTSPGSSRSIVCRRIRFVSQPVAGARIRRKFKQPRPCLAVEQTIELADAIRQPPETSDLLDIVHVPAEAKAEWDGLHSAWLAPSGDPESPEPVTIAYQGEQIHWRPGRVVIEGKTGASLRDEVVAALIEFAFMESQVRTLEASMESYESQARIDAPKTFRVKKKDRADWDRFGKIMEELAQLRLAFASLEPRVERGSRVLAKPSRALTTRLFRAASTSHRMEGLDGRLEVCEDLYEGAVDRIADYSGWHTGHVLEVIIIALLVIESALMALELLVR